MVQFRPGSHVSKLVALLSFVGEFPFHSLDILGSERVYKALIVRLTQPEHFVNSQTGEEMDCRLFTVTGKAGAKSVRLYKRGLHMLEWVHPSAYPYYMDAFWEHHFPGDDSHRERHFRVAETVGMFMRAGFETCPYLLPELQNSQRAVIVPREPVSVTDEVRAKLKPNQDPDKLLNYVLYGKNDDPTFSYDGATAQWEPNLATNDDIGRYYLGSWENIESDMRSSSVVANGFVQMLTRTASDKFFISANEEDGCFCLYYHPADKPDSQKMKAVRAALSLPNSKKLDRPLCYEAAGWAGPLPWDLYGSAQGIADKIEYYLLDFHPYTTQYYITEPEPGVFYLLYG